MPGWRHVIVVRTAVTPVTERFGSPHHTTHQRSDLHPATRGFYIIHLVSSGDKDQVADITRPARQPTLTISPNYLSAGPGPATATATAAADSHNKIIN